MSAESTISANAPVVTLINVFTAEPQRQQEFVRPLVATTEKVVRYRPGFAEPRLYNVASVHHQSRRPGSPHCARSRCSDS